MAVGEKLTWVRDWARAGSPSPGALDTVGPIILCCGGLSGAIQDVSSIPGFHPLNTRSITSQL